MMFIPVSSVPEEKADAFLAVAAKNQDFYHGYTRNYLCRGEEYAIDTRYDNDLKQAGLLAEAA